MSLLANDLAAIEASHGPLGVAVSYGTAPVQTATALAFREEDIPEADGSGGIVLVRRRTITLRADAITGLANDQPILVGGVSYRIHQAPRHNPQGGLVKVILA